MQTEGSVESGELVALPGEGEFSASTGARNLFEGIRNVSNSLFQARDNIQDQFSTPSVYRRVKDEDLFADVISATKMEWIPPGVTGPDKKPPALLEPTSATEDGTGEATFTFYRYEGTIDAICRGRVGATGLQFCVALEPECHTKSHKVKQDAQPGYYIMNAKGKQAALMAPVIPLALADNSSMFQEYKDVFNTKRTLISVANAVNKSGTPGAYGDEDINPRNELKAFVEASKRAQTPLMKRTKLVTDEAEMMYEHPEVREEARKMHLLWKLIGEDVNEIKVNLQLMQEEIGQPPQDDSEGYSTAWATIHSLCKTLETQKGDLSSSNETAENLDRRVSEISNRLTTVRNDVNIIDTNAKTAFKAAQEAKSSVSNLHNIGGGVPLVIKDRLTEIESKLLRAGANFGSMATIVQELASRSNNAQQVVPPQTDKVAVVTYNTDMAKMNRTVADIRQAITGSSVAMGGHTFSSIVDATLFARQHLPPTCYQSFVDIMSLLHRIDGPCVYSHEVQQSEIHQSKVNRLPEQSTVVASFQTDLPPLLQGPKESYENTALFGAMKSYAAWDAGDGVTGTLNRINATLDMRVESIRNNIEQLLEAHPVGRSLCLEMLSKTATFWREFCGEIADFYRFLLVSSHGTDDAVPAAIKEQCWSVMLKMVRVFFSCSRKVRLVAEHGWSSPDPTSMYLWGTLQGHKIMEEFRQYNFHEHPKVYPQIVMFLFKTYVSKADVGRLRDSSVDAARRCATAETEVKVLKRNYDALVARVNKLERSDPKRKGKKDIEEIA